MKSTYSDVTCRTLDASERLFTSDETAMPLVIEALKHQNLDFLQQFLANNEASLLADIAHYGAILLRGFKIQSDTDFESAITALPHFKPISEAFMAEEGRIHAPKCRYVLHTNAVYKTGGTLYLGGFHSENYYSTDVPAFIAFCCLKPSAQGGETGLVNMEKVYKKLDKTLREKLESQTFYVTKWLLSEVANRYDLPVKDVETICQQFGVPIVGDKHKWAMLYKPNVLIHPVTQQKSLHINLFELPTLNEALRRIFSKDYQGRAWFWHRLVWRLPTSAFKVIERIYIALASFCYSPKNSLKILANKMKAYWVKNPQGDTPELAETKVGSCFDNAQIEELAQLIRQYYVSCLWQQGDILIVDNRKVMHAGMPGLGPRLVRALIGSPMQLPLDKQSNGIFHATPACDNLGAIMSNVTMLKSTATTKQESHFSQ
ncbi:MAG: hypothetical protein CMF38_01110 [Legionellaceae bacterium]|nr:hypothetical protein [Legionellaceae bacterium]HAF88115.1 hypothetical protein [Legionellales bacterium]HCA89100.1 hypothetical protein [Legionellales bacterium]|tara:strand:- start:3436 stop:4728 length:1293 start_codon:yes stop_codon:yes gene_type:complete